MDNDDLAQQLLNEFNVSTEESRIDDNECEENDARFDNNENYISNGQRLIKFNFSWIEGLRSPKDRLTISVGTRRGEHLLLQRNQYKIQCDRMHLLWKWLQRTYFYYGGWYGIKRDERIKPYAWIIIPGI